MRLVVDPTPLPQLTTTYTTTSRHCAWVSTSRVIPLLTVRLPSLAFIGIRLRSPGTSLRRTGPQLPPHNILAASKRCIRSLTWPLKLLCCSPRQAANHALFGLPSIASAQFCFQKFPSILSGATCDRFLISTTFQHIPTSDQFGFPCGHRRNNIRNNSLEWLCRRAASSILAISYRIVFFFFLKRASLLRIF